MLCNISSTRWWFLNPHLLLQHSKNESSKHGYKRTLRCSKKGFGLACLLWIGTTTTTSPGGFTLTSHQLFFSIATSNTATRMSGRTWIKSKVLAEPTSLFFINNDTRHILHSPTSNELTILKSVSTRGVHHFSRSLREHPVFHFSIVSCKNIYQKSWDVMEETQPWKWN